MKTFIVAIVTFASIIATSGAANVPPSGGLCIEVCRPVRPVCPVGQAPTGSEGCWGCCQFIN